MNWELQRRTTQNHFGAEASRGRTDGSAITEVKGVSDPRGVWESFNSFGEKALEAVTGTKLNGKKGSASSAKASLLAEGLNVVNDWVFDRGVKSRLNQDLGSIADEAAHLVPMAGGGVLIAILIGKTPTSAGGYAEEYLGVQPLTGGATLIEARSKLTKGRLEYHGKTGGFRSQIGTCTIDEANKPPSKKSGATIGPAPKGYNSAYRSGVYQKMQKYLNKNPSNRNISLGDGVLATAYIEERLIFVSEKKLGELAANR